MSRHAAPAGLLDRLIEVAVGLLVLMLLLWFIVWIICKIWFFLALGLVLVVGIWIAIRWWRWRNTGEW